MVPRYLETGCAPEDQIIDDLFKYLVSWYAVISVISFRILSEQLQHLNILSYNRLTTKWEQNLNHVTTWKPRLQL